MSAAFTPRRLLTTLLLGAVVWSTSCAEQCPPPPPDGGVDDAGLFDGGVGDDFYDPLSMPKTPTHDVNAFSSAQDCARCHTQHYAEWRTSMHSYAMIDPVYRALVQLRQDERDGEEDMFCVQCHSAIGTRGGEIQPFFEFDTLSDVVLEGVNCQACHLITDVERPFNAGHVLSPLSGVQGLSLIHI